VLPVVDKIAKVARELTPQNVEVGKQIIQANARDITRMLSPQDKAGVDVIEQGMAEGPKEVVGLANFAMGGGILGGQNPTDILSEKGVAEGEGNLSKALDTLSGSWSGWHQVKSRNSDIEKFEWDDGEGGFYAGGSIEHNLKTGEVTVDYHGEYDDEVKGTFKNMGDAMQALRGGHPGGHGGRAPNFDRLGQRTPPGPDDLRKTDRTGRKGTIGGGYANQLKGSIQANKGRLGPKGVLPEQGMAEARDDYVPPKEANYDDKYQAMVRRVGEKARAQEKAKQQQQSPKAPVRESRLALLKQIIQS
jgi:hypothetical protein